MSKAKSEALHKKMHGEHKEGCKKCGKEKSHRIHKDEEHPKHHAYAANVEFAKEKGDEEEGKEEEREKE